MPLPGSAAMLLSFDVVALYRMDYALTAREVGA